jgi:ABC-type polysaccharide/polyol phosphate transport system ATPase subunit
VSEPAAPAIRLEGVRKDYTLEQGARRAWQMLRGTPPARFKTALHDLDLAVEAGTTLGIIGRNGSGQTTLLRIVAGSLAPSAGRVEVRGRTATLIDLGAGIDPDSTGRENALLLGLLAGATRKQMQAALDAVQEFSGLGAAFEQPARTYSAGMSLRLAFAAAAHADPEVLLVDEVLAVGDAFFQQRCMMRVRELQRRRCTVLMVTHDPSSVFGFCSRAIWLEHGRIAASGDPARVVREYMGARYRDAASLDSDLVEASPARAEEAPGDALEPALEIPNIDHRYGDGAARIEGIALRDADRKALVMPVRGEIVRVVVSARAISAIERPNVGFTLRNRLGEVVAATNTTYEGRPLPALASGARVTVEFTLRWPALASGAFSFSPAIANGDLDRHHMNDWIDNAIVMEATNLDARYGWLQLEDVVVQAHVERDVP